MQLITLALGLSASAVLASPLTVETRQAAKCPDYGTTINGPIIAPTDAEASLCCVYGQALESCCRNKPFTDDPYWSKALPCDSPWFADINAFNRFYVCTVDPCRGICEGVPPVYDNNTCQK